MLLMENGNRREVSGHLMGKKCKNCCILMGKRIFAEAAPVSRYAVMLVTACFHCYGRMFSLLWPRP